MLSWGLSFCGGADGASFAPAAGSMHCGETVGTERIRCKITYVQGGDTITASGESIRLASNESVEPAAILMQASGMKPETAYVDLGYRGVDKDNLGLGIKRRGKFKRLTEEEKSHSNDDKRSNRSSATRKRTTG